MWIEVSMGKSYINGGFSIAMSDYRRLFGGLNAYMKIFGECHLGLEISLNMDWFWWLYLHRLSQSCTEFSNIWWFTACIFCTKLFSLIGEDVNTKGRSFDHSMWRTNGQNLPVTSRNKTNHIDLRTFDALDQCWSWKQVTIWHNYGKSRFLMGNLTINGHVQ